MKKFLLLILLILFGWPYAPAVAGIAENLRGRILLNVEGKGEAWYVNPADSKRYFLGRPQDAFNVMRQLGVGITESDFQKIAQAGMPIAGDVDLAKKLSGKILLQVERNGEAWYIYPKDLKKYYLGRPADAFRVMRELSLGISRADLARIHKHGAYESISQFSSYAHKTIATTDGSFAVDMVEIDLSNPNLKIITDTANGDRCEKNCPARSLISYALANKAFAAINGTYFCTSSGCEPNYFFFPVYNSGAGTMINESELKYWTTGPIMVFGQNNKFYYFKDSREFKSVSDFEIAHNTKIKAAIGNKPRLIENYMNQLIDWDIDKGQRETKTTRNAIAYKNNKVYLVVAHKATVPNLANIMKAMEMEYALNLDGGYSSALFYNDEYMVGPGRNIPNAILFSEL